MDSTTVLSWIASPGKLKTYCANRVGEILTLCKAEQWKHIPGRLNPADSATRGIELKDVAKLWFDAPQFLLNNEPIWVTNQIMEQSNATTVSPSTTPLIISSRFSDWFRLVRVTARVIVFVGTLKGNGKRSTTMEELEKLSSSFINSPSKKPLVTPRINYEPNNKLKTKTNCNSCHLFSTTVLFAREDDYETDLYRTQQSIQSFLTQRTQLCV